MKITREFVIAAAAGLGSTLFIACGSAPPLNTKSSPGHEPERSSAFPSASRSANWGPNPTHQPVGTQPSGLPSLNFAPAAHISG